MFVSTHWALCVSSSPFRFLLKWFLLWKVEAQRAVMMNVVLMRDSFVAAGLQHAGCGDGDPPPVQLQRGFPGLFLSLSVSAVFLGLPFFPLHQASADPSLKSISLSVGLYNFPASPSLCLPWRKKGCSKQRAVDPT